MKTSELQSGTPIAPTEAAVVTPAMLSAYAKASGDHNPIHLDEAVAKKVGLPGVIAHGMLSMAWLARGARAFVASLEDGAGWHLVSSQTRFRSMTFLGDRIAVGGQVKEVTAETLVIELQCRNPKGDATTTGNFRFRRP